MASVINQDSSRDQLESLGQDPEHNGNQPFAAEDNQTKTIMDQLPSQHQLRQSSSAQSQDDGVMQSEMYPKTSQ